MNNLGMMILTL